MQQVKALLFQTPFFAPEVNTGLKRRGIHSSQDLESVRYVYVIKLYCCSPCYWMCFTARNGGFQSGILSLLPLW